MRSVAAEPSNGSEPADNATAYERFEALAKRLVAVPKSDIDAARKKSAAKRSRPAA
jgi:hypothetical protein